MKPLLVLAICTTLAGAQSEDLIRLHTMERIAAHAALDLFLREGTIQEAFPLSWLPKDLEYPGGKVSLIPDPRDLYEQHMALYLVNATDQPLKKAIDPQRYAYKEVRTEGQWEGTYRSRGTCGTIDPANPRPEPKDLPPGHAILVPGRNPLGGDREGELRYSFYLESAGSILSPAIRGRFSSEEFQIREIGDAEDSVFRWPPLKRGDGPFNWCAGKDPKDEEMLLVKLQLARLSGAASYVPRSARRWLAYLDQHDGNPQCREALRDLLQEDWKPGEDTSAFFQRSMDALAADHAKEPAYGSPERFPDLIWSLLDQLAGQGSKMHPALKADQAQGLVALALLRAKNPGHAENEAAARFLRGGWITPALLPDDEFRQLLQVESAPARELAVGGLARRGLRDEAGTWLSAHFRELPAGELSTLQSMVSARGQVAEWEIPILLDLLRKEDSRAVFRLAVVADDSFGNLHPTLLPEAFREPLRQLLQKEADTPTVKGQSPPQRDATGKWAFPHSNPDYKKTERLRQYLWILAHWKNPGDLKLIKAFLKHPAAHYEGGEHHAIKCYDIRTEAVDVLGRRHDEIPTDVQLKEELTP